MHADAPFKTPHTSEVDTFMQLETDYLVVGAGASGMAFVDALIEHSDADVIMVDRRHRPGGHWHDAYPFVRLHQPAACYGVSSTDLGQDRIDERGNNAGMYELSSAPQICSYYAEVMDRVLLPSGRVRFLAMSEYREQGPNDYRVVSLLTGEEMRIRVRRRVVDATYIEPDIPSRRRPEFEIDPGVMVIAPNYLVEIGSAPSGFTVLGAGKTAMDTCTWLLENGVEADSITWVRSRDVWSIDRAWTQPLDLVESRARFNAIWLKAAAEADSGADMALRLEQEGLFVRIDDGVPPTAFRGATISRAEVEGLQAIRNVVRDGRVQRLRTDGMELSGGFHAQPDDQVYVDCTATGLRALTPHPVFEPGRITLQYVTPGYACWSAATLAVVEALCDDDPLKEHLSLPVIYTGNVDDLLSFTDAFLTSAARRSEQADIRAWSGHTRLNPARGLRERASDPQLRQALDEARSWVEPALRNIEKHVGRVESRPWTA
ncbi:NAD(P)-binding protein [Nocardioides pocheonensis]|uniref:NAD(P)-binding protein n=1 Tax=Nocardioides pocheonensis TaxID=661485 RepID=UPI0011CEC9C3|nr:NAD(P)-binding protein [Nocardioides pocheonensis]